MLTMTARIQQVPPDHRGGHDLELGELQTTADDYDAALEKVASEVPDGWRIISIMVDR